MENMTIARFVSEFSVNKVAEDKVTFFVPGSRKKEAESILAYCKEHKTEIIAYIDAQVEARMQAVRERQAKIDAIEGLKEIQEALQKESDWRQAFSKSFDDVGGLGVGAKPVYDFEAAYARYPRAAAYLKAKSWSNASNYAKASAGKRAVEKIIDGADEKATIAEMEAEWTEHCNAHIWD